MKSFENSCFFGHNFTSNLGKIQESSGIGGRYHQNREVMNIPKNDMQEELSRIFTDLFTFTCKELDNLGIKVEPGEVMHKLICPVKDTYTKSFSELFWSFAKAKKTEIDKTVLEFYAPRS